jgi:Family of unknown function (DUF6364)
MHTMKRRITLTIDPAVTRRAKKLAHARRTSVSGLVEEFLRTAPLATGDTRESFAERWAGKFGVARTAPGDRRMRMLKARYRLGRQ